jgi:hypothetical protein
MFPLPRVNAGFKYAGVIVANFAISTIKIKPRRRPITIVRAKITLHLFLSGYALWEGLDLFKASDY